MSFPARARFGEQTPPALFPSLFGLTGLAICWRRAGGVFDLGPAPGDLLLGVAVALFGYAALAYLMKVMRRPGVFMEDLAILPGRAGLSALSLTVPLIAVGLAGIAPGIADLFMWGGLLLHVGLALAVVSALLGGPAEQRLVTPVWHLSFVGFIVTAFAAAELGQTGVAWGILLVTLPAAIGIWGISLWQFARHVPPAPLRPLLAIHLAPASLFGTVALGVGQVAVAQVFAGLALAILVMFVVSLRWMLAAGFSPFWGAMTFPLAAVTGLVLGLAAETGSLVLGLLGAGLLATASVFIPYVVYRVVKLWAGGQLAAKTNAARA